MEEKSQACASGDPAQPLDEIPAQHDHQHDAGEQSQHQQHREQLPQAEGYAACPFSQGGLEHPGDVGVNHVDE